MTFQEKYARYYNFLYQDKDYKGEVDYIRSLIRRYQPHAQSILDLGCGTGSHALLLAEQEYQVDGVDSSAKMIEAANMQLCNQPQDIISRIKFEVGDIRTIRLKQKYDVLVSLFHVMSYQTLNEDLSAVFETAKLHLSPGGIFIFDCWYGPGVLSDRPSTKIKRLENESVSIVRIAEPVMFSAENLVDVNYQCFITNKEDDTSESFKETHRMRYIFQSEVKLFLEKFQMEFVECREWMTDAVPSLNSWNVCFIVRV
jgi:SAM-dependent methyltransferase